MFLDLDFYITISRVWRMVNIKPCRSIYGPLSKNDVSGRRDRGAAWARDPMFCAAGPAARRCWNRQDPEGS